MINWTGPYGASQQSTQRFGSLPTLRQAKMYAQLYFCFTLIRNVKNITTSKRENTVNSVEYIFKTFEVYFSDWFK